MAVQTTVEQRVAQTTGAAPGGEETLAALSGTPAPNQAQQGKELSDVLQAGEAEAANLVRAAEAVPRPALIVVAAASAALIGFGLTRSRVRPALRQLAMSAEDIRIPVWVPVTLVEVAWELIADRRALSSVVSRR